MLAMDDVREMVDGSTSDRVWEQVLCHLYAQMGAQGGLQFWPTTLMFVRPLVRAQVREQVHEASA